jgi:hypothetical protein
MTTTHPTREQALEQLLELDAELRVLDLYDDARTALRYDYGNGQRHAELSRTRRKRDEQRLAFRYQFGETSLLELESDRERQLRAYERITKRRLARYSSEREGYTNRTQRLAVQAWRSVKRELDSLA